MVIAIIAMSCISARAGWLAIDPKDRFGERGFDFAQVLCNPDLTHAAEHARFATQLAVVAEAARMDVTRLARWTAVRAALSACWLIEDGDDAGVRHDLAIANPRSLGWISVRRETQRQTITLLLGTPRSGD